ncbi:MAG: hypothetical protein AAGJ40_17765 [Planctomycetota bacterium]
MGRAQSIFVPIVSLLFTVPTAADHHSGHHSHGPKGGAMVALGDGEFFVELLVQKGELVTARVMDQDKKPVSIDAAHLTLTFTERSGEKEDYKIEAKVTDEIGSVFQRTDDHVVHHIMRDKMSIKVNAGGGEKASETFAYPHGPNGGEIVNLGPSGHHAELIVQGDVVRVHVLNKRKRPVKVDAKELTLTFTEKDGEKEDYQIPVKTSKGKGTVFERVDDHVVKHVKRDKITIHVTSGDQTFTSKTFQYSAK